LSRDADLVALLKPQKSTKSSREMEIQALIPVVPFRGSSNPEILAVEIE
jgi:hypothetical protein